LNQVIDTSPSGIWDWVRHHLAAQFTGGPASNHGRELPCCASCNNDMQRFRRAELLVTALTIDRDLAVHCPELRAFTGFILKMSYRDAGILKQEFPHLLLAEAVT